MDRRPTEGSARRAILALLLCAGCTQTNVVPVTVGEVDVIPDRFDALVSDQASLTAQMRDQEGNVLPDRPVRWASLNPDVVTVDGEGVVTAVGPGQSLVTATVDGAVGAAQVTVQERPRVRLSPHELDLETVHTSNATTSETVVVDNGGGGTLGTLSADVTGGADDWLSADLRSDAAPTELTVSARGKGLAVGSHEGRVIVSDGESTAEVVVTLEVKERPPELDLGTSSLSFSTVGGQSPPSAKDVDVRNVGGGQLTGLGVQVGYDGTGGWLAATLSRATAPATLTVRPTTTELNPGTYSATVTVTTPVASNRSISVSYVVEDPRAFQPPEAPKDAEVDRQSSAVQITWDDESRYETRFEIQRRYRPWWSPQLTEWEPLASTAPDTESYTDPDIQGVYRYRYRVRACNDAGCSAWTESGET